MINFTKEHFSNMCDLAMESLLNNDTVTTKMGQVLNISELLHTTTINTLNSIKLNIASQINYLENQDEWVSDSVSQDKLEKLKKQKELVNLIIGYKRKQIELEENKKKKEELVKKLEALKESQKTPEDKIKEIEAQIKELD